METPTSRSDSNFYAALNAALERFRDAGNADIVALYPYDDKTDAFFAPVAFGLPETDLAHGLPDLVDQLKRFRRDEAEGKFPEDLSPSHYGSSAWLLAVKRPLISADASHEVNTTFIRRHHIRSTVGLPLLVGGRIVGVVYLNYVGKDSAGEVDVTVPDFVARMEEVAAEVAASIDSARRAAELGVLQAMSQLVSDLAILPTDANGATSAGLEAGLERVLLTADIEAAALFAPAPGNHQLTLVASYGAPSLSSQARVLTVENPQALTQDRDIVEALGADRLYPLVTLSPRSHEQTGMLLLADHDPLVLERRLPVEHTLLQTAADLLGGALVDARLRESLGEMSRTFGAVTRISNRLHQPGASLQHTLETAVTALTDPALPELDFEFANLFLLDRLPDGKLAVVDSAGASASASIHALDGDGRHRVPSWAAPGVRPLQSRDIVAYVATRQRAVVVSALDAAGDDQFVIGYPEDRLERLAVPLLRPDGTMEGKVHAARLREAADRAPVRSDGEDVTYGITDDISLDAALFAGYGHASLVRVFVPVGTRRDRERAEGVLEAGYHISRQGRLDRVQIEALRACAATIAVAVDTARLHEEAILRAEQMEIITEVSRAIATSIDLEQTLRLIARNMARAVDASICLIALLDDDGSAWYGAAASDQEDIWRQRRVERSERSIVFEAADRGRPIVVEDAEHHELVSPYMARLLNIRSLVALPLVTGEGSLGAVILGQREHRDFLPEEVDRAAGLATQAAVAIRNARLHAREEEEHHIQKDVIQVGFGQWGQKAYNHLLLLKNFFNFRVHVVEQDLPGRREALAEQAELIRANGDLLYWDSPANPAREALMHELEPSCYVITYIVTPAETHLPTLKNYYDLSDVVLIEKPLGASPEEYRAFLDETDGSVQIVAADHYWFKMEVRLLEILLNEERNLNAFLEEIEEVEIEILEEQAPTGSGAQIGMIADLIPHAFAVLSLVTPLDRLKLADHRALQIGRYQPLHSDRETYARLTGFFPYHGRDVRVTIDLGKGVANEKWIKLIGPRRMGGRRSFYKFDFTKGEVLDGTQSALRAATRPIRQPGVPDNAHLSMMRHVIEKKYPAVGILSIHEALRANARIRELEQMAAGLMESGQWTPYEQGQSPNFPTDVVHLNAPVPAEAPAMG